MLKLTEMTAKMIRESISYPRVEFELRRRRSRHVKKALIFRVCRVVTSVSCVVTRHSIISTHNILTGKENCEWSAVRRRRG